MKKDKEIQKEIEDLLHILERRRSPTFETLDGLSSRLNIPRTDITKKVGSLKLSFLVKHIDELYAASKFLGVDLEDLMLNATRTYMEKVKKEIQADPFVGSGMAQQYRKQLEEELYRDRK